MAEVCEEGKGRPMLARLGWTRKAVRPHGLLRRLADGGLRRTRLAAAGVAVLFVISCTWLQPGGARPGTPAAFLPIATLVPLPTATVRPTPPAGEASAGTLTIAALSTSEVERFRPVEVTLRTDVKPVNPFDPDELNIRVTFTSPSGKEVEVGAFWYQAYDPSGSRPVGEPGWRARFTPTEVGVYSAVACDPGRGLVSARVSFRVVASDLHGFVRVHPVNPRYLAFDDGSFFFPIGLNMGWWSGAGDALTDYQKWLDLFAGNGGNTIRVWMASWSFGLEWDDTPLGDYDHRLKRAWYLDQLLEMADQRQVYVILVLLNACDFSDWTGCQWASNPYNATQAGPLETPGDFATDPTARTFFQRRLNYIVNRWGYSPNVFAWEWWNEVNLSAIPDEALIPWLQEMTAYLRARDVNHHLTTNSYAIRDISPLWRIPELDLIMKHEYADQVRSQDRDLASRAARDFRALAESAPSKPILLGEFGYAAANYGDDVEKTGIHLHNGLWATTFAGYAGSGMYWWWDVYIETNHLWRHFRVLQRFLSDEDLSRYEPFSPLSITLPSGKEAPAVGLGLKGDRVLVWMRSDAYTVQASAAARAETGAVYTPPLLEGLVLTLDEMQDGHYEVRWYDPQRGEWLEPDEATAQGGRLTLAIPGFRRDLAAKIARIP